MLWERSSKLTSTPAPCFLRGPPPRAHATTGHSPPRALRDQQAGRNGVWVILSVEPDELPGRPYHKNEGDTDTVTFLLI